MPPAMKAPARRESFREGTMGATCGNLATCIGTTTLLASLTCGVMLAEEVGPLEIAKQGYFFVGGKYVDTASGSVFAGQAYVEYQIPKDRTHPYPIVMIEGCCTSGAGFN